MKEKVRVLRILEYVGTREWIESTLRNGRVPLVGTKEIGKDNFIRCFIQSGIVGDFPEVKEIEVK